MRVLLIDDDKDLRGCLKDQLVGLGHSVFEAENGEAGLNTLKSENVDLVISDIQMPILNGVGFLKKAREQYPTLPIFLMTGFSPYTEKQILGMGANGYIEKPMINLHSIIAQISVRVA